MAKIGIDLGTTNSLAAYWTKDGPQIIPNVFGDNLTPSVVSVDENDEILIGKIAKERLITHPSFTASVFKRFMGTRKTYHLGNYTFSPTDLSSFVLRSLKADAEAYLHEPVEEAIISVPAYFNDIQRKATKQAADIAGLYVERLVNEPTAAAISYGFDKADETSNILVFDLGGGTFDVSILEIFDNIMQVKAIAGDNHLGGEDFTYSIMNYFAKANNIYLNGLDPKILSMIYKQAESCKCCLSTEKYATMLLEIDHNTWSANISIDIFIKLCEPLLQRLRAPMERAIHDAELSLSEIDAVILIGGSTLMPAVKSIVGIMTGKKPYSNINPHEAVALGAAVQLALKEKDAALREMVMTDVCPYTLGIEISKKIQSSHESGYFMPIIERNTPIPVSRVETCNTIQDNQKQIQLSIYQGENRHVENNILLGELELSVPPAPAGEVMVDIRFTYDINGILEVETLVQKTDQKNRLIINNSSSNLTDEEIEERLKQLGAIKIHPRDRAENRLLLARGERLFQESRGEARDYIDNLLQIFESALKGQDDSKIKETYERVSALFDEFEGQDLF